MQTEMPESLSAEAERLLNAAPDHVGEQLPDAAEAGAPVLTEDQIRSDIPGLLETGTAIVSVQQAGEILRGVGSALAGWRKRDAYALAGDNAAGTCSASLASVLNRVWAQMAPGLMVALETQYPGLTALCIGLTFAFGPAVMEDIRESGDKRARVGIVETPVGAAQPEPVQPGPVVVERSNGLIVARGRK